MPTGTNQSEDEEIDRNRYTTNSVNRNNDDGEQTNASGLNGRLTSTIQNDDANNHPQQVNNHTNISGARDDGVSSNNIDNYTNNRALQMPSFYTRRSVEHNASSNDNDTQLTCHRYVSSGPCGAASTALDAYAVDAQLSFMPRRSNMSSEQRRTNANSSHTSQSTFGPGNRENLIAILGRVLRMLNEDGFREQGEGERSDNADKDDRNNSASGKPLQ